MNNLLSLRTYLARCTLAAALVLLLSGCGTLVSKVSQGFSQDLSSAILNSEDLEMVRDGAPSYLILIDSLLAANPDDAVLLSQSATLHSAYASAFVADGPRAKLLHNKARRQAFKATCLQLKNACDLDTRAYNEFFDWLAQRREGEVDALYNLASTWAGWMQANSDDFAAIAELARVKALMQKVSELSPDHENGSVYLYLGVFESLAPAGLGGKPELARSHFENAIRASQGKNLMAKVMFAEQYARLVFDRALHDKLLDQVLETPAHSPGLTLMNTVAQQRARSLLDTADDYF